MNLKLSVCDVSCETREEISLAVCFNAATSVKPFLFHFATIHKIAKICETTYIHVSYTARTRLGKLNFRFRNELLHFHLCPLRLKSIVYRRRTSIETIINVD